MNVAYRKKNFKVYHAGDEFIIHNMNKKFEEGHTHIKNYKACVYLIDLALHYSIPRDLNKYFLVSLKRISTDKDYIRKLDELIEIKSKKERKNYYNKSATFSKRKYNKK